MPDASSSRLPNACQVLSVDVSEAAGLGEKLEAVVTVHYPDREDLGDHPVVVFALPGASYNRQYFTFDMPGSSGGGEAGWHARRGWIFVAIDTVGVGDASLPDPAKLDLRTMASINHTAVQAVLDCLAAGSLIDRLRPVRNPTALGLGQSMGGGITIAQQAYHDTYDAVAILGFSAVWTTSRTRPGTRPANMPFLARDTALTGLVGPEPDAHAARCAAASNSRLLELQSNPELYPNKIETPRGWHFHFDDVPEDIRRADLGMSGETPAWRSPTVPGGVFSILAPGSLGPEAAAIVVPVLSAFGERDVAEDPRLEHKAFRHAVDFSSFICPRMGHMHNFASTRELLWLRIHHWGEYVRSLKALIPDDWPAQLLSDSY